MSSISPTELYLEMRSEPVIMERLYKATHADDTAAIVYEFASAKGHQLEMSEIYDGLWDAQNIVSGAVAENARNDNEKRLAEEGQEFVMQPVGDELSDAELEMVSAGKAEGVCYEPCPGTAVKPYT